MASKQGYAADLKSYIDKRLKITLNGKRIFNIPLSVPYKKLLILYEE